MKKCEKCGEEQVMYYGCVNKDCDRYYKKLDKDGYGEFKTSKKE